MTRAIPLLLTAVFALSGVPSMVWGMGCCRPATESVADASPSKCPLCPGPSENRDTPTPTGSGCGETAVCCTVPLLDLPPKAVAAAPVASPPVAVAPAFLRALGDVEPPTAVPKLG